MLGMARLQRYTTPDYVPIGANATPPRIAGGNTKL